jgi:hypothetical protein
VEEALRRLWRAVEDKKSAAAEVEAAAAGGKPKNRVYDPLASYS